MEKGQVTIGITQDGNVGIFEYKADREYLKCRNDIIILPPHIFDKMFLSTLKRQKILVINDNIVSEH